MKRHPQSARVVFAWLGVSYLLGACGVQPENGSTSREALIGAQTSPGAVELSTEQQRAVGRLMFGVDTLCTGTLVSSRHVLTAAHCFNAEIGAGRVDFIPGGVVSEARLPVVLVQKHPTLDVALATLGVEVDAMQVTPLSVNEEAPDASWLGQAIEFAGSGFGTSPSLGVGWATFSLVSIEPAQLTVDGDELHNACRGDSGGPWLKRFAVAPVTRIVAVVSAGTASCDGNNWGPRADLAAAWVRSRLGSPQPSLSERCSGSETSRCEAEFASACVDGWWRVVDCAAAGRTCGWLPEGPACLPKTCGAVDGHGTCAGGVASWCGPGGVESLDCGARGLGCGWSEAERGFRCLDCVTCQGTCVELTSDVQNCGACGRQCPASASCEAGSCVFPVSREHTTLPAPPATGCLVVDGAATWTFLALAFARRRRG